MRARPDRKAQAPAPVGCPTLGFEEAVRGADDPETSSGEARELGVKRLEPFDARGRG